MSIISKLIYKSSVIPNQSQIFLVVVIVRKHDRGQSLTEIKEKKKPKQTKFINIARKIL